MRNTKAHANSASSMTYSGAAAILRVHWSQRRCFIPAAFEIFNTKSIAQLLNGAQLAPSFSFISCEKESGFLRLLFMTLRSVPNAALSVKAGLWIAITLALDKAKEVIIGVIQLQNEPSCVIKISDLKEM